MKPKRLVFGVIAAALAAGAVLAPRPARACDDDDYSYRRSYYRSHRSYGGDYRAQGYYGGDYRAQGYYGGDYGARGDYCSRPREAYYESRQVHRYVCDDCGRSFDSRYWLSYHRRHTSCD